MITLPWLRRLRWTAVAGQSATVLWVHFGLQLTLPLTQVFTLIAFTAVTNIVLHATPPWRREHPWAVCGILATDVIVLTELLYFTGGSHNPFSSFYLVHVTLAALALPPLCSGLITMLCAFGFASLFIANLGPTRSVDTVCGVGPDMPTQLHLNGMLVSFVLTAGWITFFVARLQSAIHQRDRELSQSRERALEQEQFAALATLAAGAAHELGTPLGTITVAASEIARTIRMEGTNSEVAADAELICEEARRCREILDRLHQTAGDPTRRIELGSLFKEVQQRLGPAATQVRFDPAATHLAVNSPNEALLQATLSLVRNAIDATQTEEPVRVSAEPRAGKIYVTVSDVGTGLGPEASLHAGEPFFTTKGPGLGMGLGLFLVRLVAERVGGSFRLEQNQPCGTRAILELPGAV